MAKKGKKKQRFEELGVGRTVFMSSQPDREPDPPDPEPDPPDPEPDPPDLDDEQEDLENEAANDSRHLSTSRLLLRQQDMKQQIVQLRELLDRLHLELAATSKALKVAEATHTGLSAIISSRG